MKQKISFRVHWTSSIRNIVHWPMFIVPVLGRKIDIYFVRYSAFKRTMWTTIHRFPHSFTYSCNMLAHKQTDWLTGWLTYLLGIPIHFQLITFVRFWVQRNFQLYSDYFLCASVFFPSFSLFILSFAVDAHTHNFQHPKWHISSLSNELLNVLGLVLLSLCLRWFTALIFRNNGTNIWENKKKHSRALRISMARK